MQLSSTNIGQLAHAYPRCKICGNLIMCYWRTEQSLHSLGIWVVAVCEGRNDYSSDVGHIVPV